MERLSGLDATFLYSETAAAHMHTLKIAVVDRPPGSPAEVFARFRDELAKRLHLLPGFRLRAVEVPLGLGHPVWVEDAGFELDFHLHLGSLPAPGGAREMDEAIADIASHALDRRHPLWEIWLLDGRSDGRLVYVAKLHHALADGVASAAMVSNVMSPDPDPALAVDATGAEWVPEPTPGRVRLAADALREQPARVARLPGLVARTVRGGVSVLARYREATEHPPTPFVAPRTPLNVALSPSRSFASTRLPLARVKAVKEALGATLNDVVLAMVGGAVARWLEAHGGGRPSSSLVAAVPMSVGTEVEARLRGNRLSNMFVSLATDVADPVERVRAIHRSAVASKDTHARLGGDVMLSWSEYAPPSVVRGVFALYSGLALADRHAPAANLIVSNVRGPAQPLYVAGMRLRELYSVGPVLDGMALNLTAWSYGEDLGVSAIACRRVLPEAHAVTDELEAALAELEAAAERSGACASS